MRLCFLSRDSEVYFGIRKTPTRLRLTNTRGQRPRRANTRVRPGAPRLAADFFRGQRLKGYRSTRYRPLRWAGAAPPPHAGSSDGDVAVGLLSVVVMWRLVV